MSRSVTSRADGGTASVPPISEVEIESTGSRLLQKMAEVPAPSFFSKKGAYARLMEWSMHDPAFKTQLFRFVDVLPSLRSAKDVVQHLQEYLGDRAVELHPGLKAGLAAAGLAPALVAGPVRNQVTAMAKDFVAGETPKDLIKRFRANAAQGVATTIDLLGETVVSAEEADAFLQRNLDLLDTVSEAVKGSSPSFSDLGANGPLPRLNLSVKISALCPLVDPIDPRRSIDALKVRLRPILRKAQATGAFINFDMESYRLKDLTMQLFRSVLEEPEFQDSPPAGIALQAYLRDAEADLNTLVEWARGRRRLITVRLVKGAYWDYETVLAQQRNWPVPVWENKAETDLNFERLTAQLLEASDCVMPAFATHNVRSCAQAIVQNRARGLDPRWIEFQSLYGMAEDLKAALLSEGYRCREYCPIGDLLPGMSYLVRRLLENTSNESFLRAKHADALAPAELLRSPLAHLSAAPARTPSSTPRPKPGAELFTNVANTDFVRPEARHRLTEALNTRRARSPQTSSGILIGGKWMVRDRETLPSINPAHPDQILGYWTRGRAEDADAAVATARGAFGDWSKRSPTERAEMMRRLADILEKRRFELVALEILEAGKPWVEADADVSEAIDFCRFYACEAERLGRGRRTQATPGERNIERFAPRGVAVVISPWNFPLAILCGMTVAAAVGGNTVVMKPAEQTSLIAVELMKAMMEAGVPDGVINLLSGMGEEVGTTLVNHPGVDLIAFTGSRQVGLQVWRAAGQTLPGQRTLKKAICEMGGKNSLIIDSDADFDEAIPAVLYSAFGFSGQKCSALSRLIVHADVVEAFTARLIDAAESLPIGDPAEAGTTVGPVIDEDAHAKISQKIDAGIGEAQLAFQATISTDLLASKGFYVPPTIFTNVAPESALAREEIFGPVLAVLTAADLDEAFRLANDSTYALTAGIFSRRPSALRRAEDELVAGNVYLNRPITGALVERHPFGGYKMSGGGTKAGGRGYLEQFLFARTISENTLRRGFTPPED